MDDTLCQQFFRQPSQALHCRYETLRAFFIEGLSCSTIAQRGELSYHTVRSWVRDFRAPCRDGNLPPFLSNRTWADRLPASARSYSIPKLRPSPTAGK